MHDGINTGRGGLRTPYRSGFKPALLISNSVVSLIPDMLAAQLHIFFGAFELRVMPLAELAAS